MVRRYILKESSYKIDPLYQSRLVHILANRIIRHGKKLLSYRIVYSALNKLQEKTQQDSLAILEHAIRIVSPTVQLEARRVGGMTYQVPTEVNPRIRTIIAIKWLLNAARIRPGHGIVFSLYIEIIDAARGTGIAVQKCREVHRIAEANKLFARYRLS